MHVNYDALNGSYPEYGKSCSDPLKWEAYPSITW
ncbi:unnamed protein product [Strongylus vulgaris]|uniref:Uncharacterized protein n=1 Tax=Strongylus vulgaris TaxID=40348 RepID=A0A3P7IQ79_STRVU|nr:unnamed protein product [Strongylus vulgaris]